MFSTLCDRFSCVGACASACWRLPGMGLRVRGAAGDVVAAFRRFIDTKQACFFLQYETTVSKDIATICRPVLLIYIAWKNMVLYIISSAGAAIAQVYLHGHCRENSKHVHLSACLLSNYYRHKHRE